MSNNYIAILGLIAAFSAPALTYFLWIRGKKEKEEKRFSDIEKNVENNTSTINATKEVVSELKKKFLNSRKSKM